jgi:hypothetical protein
VTREELIGNSGAPILRFGFAGRLSAGEVVGYLNAWKATVTAYLEELRSFRDATDWSLALHGMLSLERGIRGFQGDIEWIDDAIATIES